MDERTHATLSPERPDWTCVDSHAHLAMPQFAADLPELLARARAAGITEILTASTSLADAERNVAIARASRIGEGPTGAGPRVRAAVGFHPHQSKEWRDGDEERLEALLKTEEPGPDSQGSPDSRAAEPTHERRVVAVGETGLDYHYDFSPRDVQRRVFEIQVRLAARLGMPIIVHCRNAAPDVAAILDAEGGRERGGVLHCFSEDEAFARLCLDLGFYISFSGILTFRKAGLLREVARIVPADRLLVETDAPYLAPEPHRGRRNEPALAATVLTALAAIRGTDPATLAARVSANFERFLAGREGGGAPA